MEGNEELKELLIEKNRLESELMKVEMKMNMIINHMSFNIRSITKVLANLMSIKEGETYNPIFFEDKKSNINTLSFLIKNNNSDKKTINIGHVKYIQYRKIGKKTFNPYNVNITFKYLLDKYNINTMYNKNMLCEYNFSDYPYVFEFLNYLFQLQVQNNKQLTYDEMQIAMNDFIKLEKVSSKKLVKKKDLSV